MYCYKLYCSKITIELCLFLFWQLLFCSFLALHLVPTGMLSGLTLQFNSQNKNWPLYNDIQKEPASINNRVYSNMGMSACK